MAVGSRFSTPVISCLILTATSRSVSRREVLQIIPYDIRSGILGYDYDEPRMPPVIEMLCRARNYANRPIPSLHAAYLVRYCAQ